MDKLTRGWVQHQRKTARQEAASRGYQCPFCETEVQPNFEAFKVHYTLKHPTEASDIEEAFRNFTIHGNDAAKSHSSPGKPSKGTLKAGGASRKRNVSGDPDFADGAEDDLDRMDMAGDGTANSPRGSKKICSPPASITQQRGSSPPTSGRSRARPSERDDEFVRNKNPTSRQLWMAGDDRKGGDLPQRPKTPQIRQNQLAAYPGSRSSPQHRGHRDRGSLHHQSQSYQPPDEVLGPTTMLLQLDTRPISSDQLAAEVQGIYAGLVLLESKCIEYDTSQKDADLTEEQYHALISLHRSLLHEHHDFFLASQHPSASEALRRLAQKYYMPARMWRHGIHSFLELLRRKLPHALEHMLTFIYIAYTMVALLLETVPAFEDTWIECLGDLGRYRMAVEDDDIRDREIWTGVSRDWYTKASDRSPTTGRLYHHLAILARPNALQQLYYYTKSLCVPIPFQNARDSVTTLFEPLLNPTSKPIHRPEPVDAAFVRIHGILFSGKYEDQLESSIEEFLGLLDANIARRHGDWLESGYYMAISLSCLLLNFGDESNVLMQALKNSDDDQADTAMGESSEAMEKAKAKAMENLKTAVSFAARTYSVAIVRWRDLNVYPFLHALLVFHWSMMKYDAWKEHVEDSFPWELTKEMLNLLLKLHVPHPRLDTKEIPWPEGGQAHPLPEDYAMRGLIYTTEYYPAKWFDTTASEGYYPTKWSDTVASEGQARYSKYCEPPSTVFERCERILWLGHAITKRTGKLRWNDEIRRFQLDSDAKDNENENEVEPEAAVVDPAFLDPSAALGEEEVP